MEASNLTGVVVGGGIMGVSTAWSMVKNGISHVTLIDSHPLPREFGGASVDFSRSIRYNYGSDKGYMVMVADAYEAWDELFKDLGKSFYTETGSLSLQNVFVDDELKQRNLPVTQLDSYNSLIEFKEKLGIEVQYLEKDEIKSMFPYLNCEDIAFGFFTPAAGLLNARDIISETVEWLRKSPNATVLDGPEYEVVKVNPKDKPIAQENTNEKSQNSCILKSGQVISCDYIAVTVNSSTNDLVNEVRDEGKLSPVRAEITYFNVPENEIDEWKSRPIIRELKGAESFYFFPYVGGKGVNGVKVGDYHRDYNFNVKDDSWEPKEGFNKEQIKWFNDRFITDKTIVQSPRAKVCHWDLYPEDRFQLLSLDSSNSALVLYGLSGHGFKYGAIMGKAIMSVLSGRKSYQEVKNWIAGKTTFRFSEI